MIYCVETEFDFNPWSIAIVATFPLSIWDKLLLVMGEVDIGPRPDTVHPITHVTMVDCCVYLVLLAMWMIIFMKTRKVLVGVTVQDVAVGLNR